VSYIIIDLYNPTPACRQTALTLFFMEHVSRLELHLLSVDINAPSS